MGRTLRYRSPDALLTLSSLNPSPGLLQSLQIVSTRITRFKLHICAGMRLRIRGVGRRPVMLGMGRAAFSRAASSRGKRCTALYGTAQSSAISMPGGGASKALSQLWVTFEPRELSQSLSSLILSSHPCAACSNPLGPIPCVMRTLLAFLSPWPPCHVAPLGNISSCPAPRLCAFL